MMQQNQEMLGFRQQQTYYDSYPAESEHETVKEKQMPASTNDDTGETLNFKPEIQSEPTKLLTLLSCTDMS